MPTGACWIVERTDSCEVNSSNPLPQNSSSDERLRNQVLLKYFCTSNDRVSVLPSDSRTITSNVKAKPVRGSRSTQPRPNPVDDGDQVGTDCGNIDISLIERRRPPDGTDRMDMGCTPQGPVRAMIENPTEGPRIACATGI